MAILWNFMSVLIICAISLTTLWNGNLLISKSVLDWYFLIPSRLSAPSSHLFITPFSFLSTLFLLYTLSSLSLPLLLLIFFAPLSFVSLTLYALAFFIFSLAALVRVVLVLHAISITTGLHVPLSYLCYSYLMIHLLMWHIWNSGAVPGNFIVLSYIGHSDLIVLIMGYHEYGIPLGDSRCKICYLTSKESICTLTRSCWPILSNGGLIRSCWPN